MSAELHAMPDHQVWNCGYGVDVGVLGGGCEAGFGVGEGVVNTE